MVGPDSKVKDIDLILPFARRPSGAWTVARPCMASVSDNVNSRNPPLTRSSFQLHTAVVNRRSLVEEGFETGCATDVEDLLAPHCHGFGELSGRIACVDARVPDDSRGSISGEVACICRGGAGSPTAGHDKCKQESEESDSHRSTLSHLVRSIATRPAGSLKARTTAMRWTSTAGSQARAARATAGTTLSLRASSRLSESKSSMTNAMRLSPALRPRSVTSRALVQHRALHTHLDYVSQSAFELKEHIASMAAWSDCPRREGGGPEPNNRTDIE